MTSETSDENNSSVSNIGYSFTASDLESIAIETRREFLTEGTNVTRINGIEWPDCREISLAIEDKIHKQFEYYQTTVKHFVIDGYYHHHVVKITPQTHTQESVIIDASFTQFRTEADTPIDIGSQHDTPHIVVVSPAESYIFA